VASHEAARARSSGWARRPRPCALAVGLVTLLACASAVRAAEPDQGTAGRCWGVRAICGVRGHLHEAGLVSEWPRGLRARYPGAGAQLYRVDLERDRRPEYIVREPITGAAPRTCFLDSSLVERRCEDWEADGWVYYWFVELEPGAPLFLLVLSEDEDSHDYYVERVDPRTWERTRILSFEALAVTSKDGRCRWTIGHPELLTELLVERSGGKLRLRVAPPGAYLGGPGAPPDERPAILFKGKARPEAELNECGDRVRASAWMTLTQLLQGSGAVEPPTNGSR